MLDHASAIALMKRRGLMSLMLAVPDRTHHERLGPNQLLVSQPKRGHRTLLSNRNLGWLCGRRHKSLRASRANRKPLCGVGDHKRLARRQRDRARNLGGAETLGRRIERHDALFP